MPAQYEEMQSQPPSKIKPVAGVAWIQPPVCRGPNPVLGFSVVSFFGPALSLRTTLMRRKVNTTA